MPKGTTAKAEKGNEAMYKIELQETRDSSVIDTREIKTDDELFAFIGKWVLWYFLAIDNADYEDAKWHHEGRPDSRLLHFTAHKATDKAGGPHRHGLATGLLAYGHAWGYFGNNVDVRIVVKDLGE